MPDCLRQLGAYENYRARLKQDDEVAKNFAFAQQQRFILREERTFVKTVEGTLGIAPIDTESGR